MNLFLETVQALKDDDAIRLIRTNTGNLAACDITAIALDLASRLEREIQLRGYRLQIDRITQPFQADAALAQAAADWSGDAE